MRTVLESDNYELEIKKSKFISYIFHVENLADFSYFYEKLKVEHKKARHICYAYKINENIVKCSDDGEPSKTAGKPILNAIEKNDLINVAIFVVRYFGGILLGSGGLTRAYSNSATEVINSSHILEVEKMKEIEAILTYDIYDTFISYLKNKHIKILDTNFSDKIKVRFLVSLDYKEDLASMFYPSLEVLNESVKYEYVEAVKK